MSGNRVGYVSSDASRAKKAERDAERRERERKERDERRAREGWVDGRSSKARETRPDWVTRHETKNPPCICGTGLGLPCMVHDKAYIDTCIEDMLGGFLALMRKG